MDITYGLVGQFQGFFRGLPLIGGAGGILGLIANRTFSGIAPVVDASSSQSRSDVLGIVMGSILLLTGLQWLSLKPRTIPAVPLDGAEVNFLDQDAKIPARAVQELNW